MARQTMPPSPRQWFRIEASAAASSAAAAPAGDSKSADVYIYDEIGESFWGGGISPKALVDEITALDVEVLNVFINSPGGAAWDGIAIMNALRRHPARVEVTVDGVAASAASIVAMAGDHIAMNRGSELMIHDAWGFVQGNATDMADMAGVLGRLSDSLADIYAARAGGNREQWRTAMKAETWYTAEEAVAAGLADEWADKPAAQAAFDLGRYRFAGRAQAPTPRLEFEAPSLPSSPEPGANLQRGNVDMTDTALAGLRERLGVTDASASEEQLFAALDERLAKPATTMTEPPEGTVLVDSATFAELRAAANDGQRALAQLATARREGIVNAAVQEGRIAPNARATWLAQLEANEDGTTALLASLAPNTIPVAALGRSDEPSEDDQLMAALFGDDSKEV